MRRAGIFIVSVFSVVLTRAAPALAQSTGKEPAGGAAAGEAIGATACALVATALVAYLIAGHRSGKLKVLARVATWADRHTGLPAWASVPSILLGISLLTAVLGMYWDISLHIDNGRDAGPLANPAGARDGVGGARRLRGLPGRDRRADAEELERQVPGVRRQHPAGVLVPRGDQRTLRPQGQ